jgi:hypothetical protein
MVVMFLIHTRIQAKVPVVDVFMKQIVGEVFCMVTVTGLTGVIIKLLLMPIVGW